MVDKSDQELEEKAADLVNLVIDTDEPLNLFGEGVRDVDSLSQREQLKRLVGMAAARPAEMARLKERLAALGVAPYKVEALTGGARDLSRDAKSDEFKERIVRVTGAHRTAEVVDALRAGLAWMVSFHENLTIDEAWDAVDRRFGRLAEIVDELRRVVPGLLAFLEVYPLRLMTLDDHQQLLGKFLRAPAAIGRWTRYTPPRWLRGMARGEAGPVESRFLAIEDRSVPNAMGIYYRLFEHPLLRAAGPLSRVPPLMAGPTVTRQGIPNESEVLVREILFARACLAAWLANMTPSFCTRS